MKQRSTNHADVSAYIDSFSGVTKKRLQTIRQTILKVMPSATERISYNIPAYFLNGMMIVYFAGYDNHIGLYPAKATTAEYKKLVGKYSSGKATIRLPHNHPLPIDVIEKFVDLRISEVIKK